MCVRPGVKQAPEPTGGPLRSGCNAPPPPCIARRRRASRAFDAAGRQIADRGSAARNHDGRDRNHREAAAANSEHRALRARLLLQVVKGEAEDLQV